MIIGEIIGKLAEVVLIVLLIYGSVGG